MASQGVTVEPLRAIVIGGSAGAVGALCLLLGALPKDLEIPVIVVVHLPDRRPSLLPEVFAARCAAPVREPDDKQPITPGVWVAPPSYHLLVDDGCFALSLDAPIKRSRPSIDALFESAADAWGPRVAAMVLTGASDDGADGAAAIAARHGRIFVEDPATADTPIMPQATLSRVKPELVGDLRTLAAALAQLTGGV